jgi:DHA1 family bicyclomycin/chloramphenicol resistance-like MFS transporter
MPKSFLPLLILSLVACWIEVDISVPGFPDMANYFNTSDATIQLTIAYNFLGFCIAALIWGPLSDCYGRRKVMVIGNGLLALGATLCVFAENIDFLLFARFIQGVGASTSAIVVSAMIADTYKGTESSKLIGIMNSVAAILIAIAPIVGAFINQLIGWRWNYSIVAIVSVLSFILLAMGLPETKKNLEKISLHKVISDYRILLLSKRFIASSLAPSLIYSAAMSFTACAVFLYRETFGLKLMNYALHQFTIVAAFAITSTLFGRIHTKLGNNRVIILGSILSLSGTILLVLLSLIAPDSPYLTTIFMSIFTMGFALIYPPIFSMSLDMYPEIKGTASSLIMSMRAFLVASFVALSSFLYNGELLHIALVMLVAVVIVSICIISLLKNKS